MTYRKYLKLCEQEEYINLTGRLKTGSLTFRDFGEFKEYLEIARWLKKGFRFVESYNGADIYEKGGKFSPYVGCHYCFTSLQDCRDRIKLPVGYINFNM